MRTSIQKRTVSEIPDSLWLLSLFIEIILFILILRKGFVTPISISHVKIILKNLPLFLFFLSFFLPFFLSSFFLTGEAPTSRFLLLTSLQGHQVRFLEAGAEDCRVSISTAELRFPSECFTAINSHLLSGMHIAVGLRS